MSKLVKTYKINDEECTLENEASGIKLFKTTSQAIVYVVDQEDAVLFSIYADHQSAELNTDNE